MAGDPEVDYDRLEELLRALAYSSRLELLHLLKLPRPLQEIRVAPRQLKPGERGDRAMSRQAVQEHLDKLMEVGAVVTQEPSGKGRRAKHYATNTQRLYLITEELRKITTVTIGAPVARDATVGLPSTGSGELEPGPKLVLVHGALEGKAFPLRHVDLEGPRGWVLGRKSGLHVCLDYDPYVSLENSEIQRDGDRFVLFDLRSSKNGTLLNWRPLDPDERAPLRSGDVIGAGRSLLVFRED